MLRMVTMAVACFAVTMMAVVVPASQAYRVQVASFELFEGSHG